MRQNYRLANFVTVDTFHPSLMFVAETGVESRANVIKLFTAVSYEFSLKARVLAPGKLNHPTLMFVGKARSLPYSGRPERCFFLLGCSFIHKQ